MRAIGYWLLGLLFICSSGEASLERRATDIRPILEGERPLGQGIEISRKAPLLRLCGEANHFESQGMNFDYELSEIEDIDDFYFEDVETKKFLVQSLNAAKEHNIEELKRFDLYLKLKFDHGGRALPDGPTFLPYAQRLLDQGNLDKFYRLCGHNFVHSISGPSHLHLFLSYYAPDRRTMKRLVETLENRLQTHDAHDIFRLRIFSDLNFDGYVYSRLHSTTGSGLLLWEPGLSALGKNNVDHILEDVFRRLAQEEGTKANFFSYQPWTLLPEVKEICQKSSFKNLKNAIACNQGQHSEVSLLGREVLSFKRKLSLSQRLMKVKGEHRERAQKCYQFLRKRKSRMNWNIYQQCQKKVGVDGDYRLTPECQQIRQVGFEVMHNANCSNLPYKVGPRKFYATDKLDSPQQRSPRSNAPHRLGRGITLEGELKPESCSDEGSFTKIGKKHADSTTQEYHPLRVINRRDGRYIHFRARYERRDLNHSLSPHFQLNRKGTRALKRGLQTFYQECGSHYIRRRLSKKGIIIDLLFPKKDLIFNKQLTTQGPSRHQLRQIDQLLDPQKKNKGLKNILPTDVRIGIRPYGVSDRNQDHPVFDATNLQEYLRKKGAINKILATDRGKGVLVKFIAEPWNHFLNVFHGLDLQDFDFY